MNEHLIIEENLKTLSLGSFEGNLNTVVQEKTPKRVQNNFIDLLLEELKGIDMSESHLHLDMVGRVSELLAGRRGMSSESIAEIGRFARLHDIGKVGVPKEILNKKGSLTLKEFQVIKTHTEIGYNLLKNLGMPLEGLEIIRFHHEKWDGRGYYGLKGEEIPLSARIVAVADVYDALRMERPYKKAMSHEKALKIILEDSGSHFDPEIAEIFSLHSEEIEKMYILAGIHSDSYEAA